MKRLITIKTKKAKYAINIFPKSFWFHIWKPTWHEGRGRYVSIGLYLIGFYRGY